MTLGISSRNDPDTCVTPTNIEKGKFNPNFYPKEKLLLSHTSNYVSPSADEQKDSRLNAIATYMNVLQKAGNNELEQQSFGITFPPFDVPFEKWKPVQEVTSSQRSALSDSHGVEAIGKMYGVGVPLSNPINSALAPFFDLVKKACELKIIDEQRRENLLKALQENPDQAIQEILYTGISVALVQPLIQDQIRLHIKSLQYIDENLTMSDSDKTKILRQVVEQTMKSAHALSEDKWCLVNDINKRLQQGESIQGITSSNQFYDLLQALFYAGHYDDSDYRDDGNRRLPQYPAFETPRIVRHPLYQLELARERATIDAKNPLPAISTATESSPVTPTTSRP